MAVETAEDVERMSWEAEGDGAALSNYPGLGPLAVVIANEILWGIRRHLFLAGISTAKSRCCI